MSSLAIVSVAIFTEAPINHWTLYVEAEEGDGDVGVTYDVRGGVGLWAFEARYTNPRLSQTFEELVNICRIPISKVEEISTIAEDMVVPMDDCNWNCQNFVIELLADMAANNVIDETDVEFQRGLAAIRARRDVSN